jgi:7-carboxy-7-deazaguanine synthase
VIRLDVLLEEFPRRRVLVDVDGADVDAGPVQKTSGVLARRSGGLPVERFHIRTIIEEAGRSANRRDMLTVNEIFYSIQGESTRAGEPCVFVRLTACDLRCSWCDTPYAFHEGEKRSIDAVVDAVERFGCPLVEVTGGEPLLQEDVYPLMDRLVAGGRTVLLETGGHRPIDRVPAGVIAIVDVKCPSSGESGSNLSSNLERLRPHDEVKFVVQDRADYQFALDVIGRHDLTRRAAAVLMSPVHGALEPRTLAEWMLADNLRARLQVQLHKYIWSPTARGV